jgi:hypothetical protein
MKWRKVRFWDRNYKSNPLFECVCTVELVYNVMKGTEYFVSLQPSVVITREYNVVVKSEELIGTAKYPTQ